MDLKARIFHYLDEGLDELSKYFLGTYQEPGQNVIDYYGWTVPNSIYLGDGAFIVQAPRGFILVVYDDKGDKVGIKLTKEQFEILKRMT